MPACDLEQQKCVQLSFNIRREYGKDGTNKTIGPESIIQLLRDAVYAAPAGLSTSYKSGDHVICVSQSQPITISAGFNLDGITGSFGLSGSIPEGGICLFPQGMAAGASLNLSQIRPLMDALLKHGCSTCGSVPIHFVDRGSNDPADGILTFNYVENPDCIDNCISAVGGGPSESQSQVTATVTVVEGPGSSSSTFTTVPTTLDIQTTGGGVGTTVISTVTEPSSSITPTGTPSGGQTSGESNVTEMRIHWAAYIAIVSLIVRLQLLLA